MKGGFILILITNYIDNLNIKSFRIERFNDSLVEEAKEIFKNHKEKILFMVNLMMILGNY